MTEVEFRELERYFTDEERSELASLLAADIDDTPWRPLPGPQTMAYHSEADIVGYGGAAGGGKTDLLAGLALTKHKRCLVVRREKAQTEGLVQRMTELVGNTKGYNSMKGIWRLPAGSLLELAGLDNEGDERRWQGRPHDLKIFDEVTEQREAQVRFVMGWMRTNEPGLRSRVLMTFNPPTTSEGRWVIAFFAPWLDPKHPNPAGPGELRWFTTVKGKDEEVPDGRSFVILDGKRVYDFDPDKHAREDIIKPKSRTFIPARLTDNPYYMAGDYMSTLQALPEPLRSQMLKGDFSAGMNDSEWQVIPTEWVDIAMARWTDRSPKPAMDSLGVDVARGGDDKNVIIARHDHWYDRPKAYDAKEHKTGPQVAGLVIAATRDHAVVHIDVIGIGASPYDFLVEANQDVIGVNVAEGSGARDKSGRLGFANLRSELWWRMREALDPEANNGIALPPDPRLRADLCAPHWKPKGPLIQVESREEIFKRIGRSPDWGTACVLARMETPKRHDLQFAMRKRQGSEYDPFASPGVQGHGGRDYDPFAFN